ncbi:MAG: asparagine synthase (glutamine-hydrolyzing) [Hyphomicrobiales bacterium]|nr:asparagine synthase (glutamine-hydrolyzing) [Hyphomicrobiales bacterium]
MCGIAGMVRDDGGAVDPAVLARLADALDHRGPDGRGQYLAPGVGLVQTRLAIIDLAGGDQPLFGPGPVGARPALVANGEIYNYLELRQQMGEGHFATRSDCEPPAHLYARRGLAFADDLRGMYAIALHDPVAGRVVLARDPFGIKPLYLARVAGGWAFASEMRALVAAGLVAPRVRADRRDELLQLQFTTGRETLLQGVERVLPGETLVIERGAIVARRRRAALPAGGPVLQTRAAALRDLDDALNASVGLHQRADVPYGMFLSGGIDSAVLLAMMDRLNERPVRAFTVGFPGTGVHDERDQARAVAQATGAEHVEIAFTEDDFWDLLPRVAAALDDPTADYATLPTFRLAQAARDDGLKVVLSGEGGDEMFAGYGRYRRARRPRLLGGRPMRARGRLDGLHLLRDGTAWRRGLAAAEAAAALPGRTALQVLQAVDVADWLPNDLLTKLDRCLMANGVEGRVPFVDPAMAAFAFRLPDGLKVKRGKGKWLLRQWLATGLPASRPFDRKKGFTVPVGEWIARRGAALGPVLAAQPGVAEACRPGAVESLFRHPRLGADGRLGQAAWTLLFYGLWHARHVAGGAAAGEVAELLAASA